MLSFQHVNIKILHTWSPLWKHVERAQKIFLSTVVGISHSWVLCRSWRAIWSPQASTASSSSQASSDLALHSYSPHVCVCGPDWMTTMMTQSFLWVACFFQGHSTPTPPMDRSEGDAEWARSAILICCNRRWCVTSLQCRMGQSRARPWNTPFGGG